jgi:hypothetical protein
MKKSIKILCLLLVSFMANCQVATIVPINTDDYPNGAYLKDLNNELPFLVGTWEGMSNNLKFTFQFTLFTQQLKNYDDGIYNYEDEIKGKFKVTDLNTNQVIYNNLTTANYENYNITCLTIRNGREFHFGFYDNENNCYNTAYFILIKDNSNPNQVIYKDFEIGSYGGLLGCTTYQNQSDIPMYLPRVNLVLTKQ